MLIIMSLFGTWIVLMTIEALGTMTAKHPKTYKEVMETDAFKHGDSLIKGEWKE